MLSSFLRFIFELRLTHNANPCKRVRNILNEAHNATSELVSFEWASRLCLHFVLYNMRLVGWLYCCFTSTVNI